ncbi:MAG TPA: DUF3800 domain-containing protein [Pirellulales bacterium]
MYFFYVDESGTLDAAAIGQRPDGSTFAKDHLYVLAAVSLFERRWHGFEQTLNRKKRELCEIHRRTNPTTPRLELADCEIKSTWTRIPKERAQRPFLANLTDGELTQLVELFYRQLEHHNMNIFIYRCFRDQNPTYPFFARIAPYLWASHLTNAGLLDGLWVFPAESPLVPFKVNLAKERANRDAAGP